MQCNQPARYISLDFEGDIRYLDVTAPLLPCLELSSVRVLEEPLVLELRLLTPLSALLELSLRLSSREL
jgi:hypothetical protein